MEKPCSRRANSLAVEANDHVLIVVKNGYKREEKIKPVWFFVVCLCCVFAMFISVTISALGALVFSPETKSECINFYVDVCNKSQSRITSTFPKRQIDEQELRYIGTSYGNEEISKIFTLMITACLNTEQINKVGVKPLRTLLTTFGDLPVLKGDNWKGDMFTTFTVMGAVTERLTTNGLFNVYLVPNFLSDRTPVILVSTVMEFIFSTPPYVTPRTNVRIDPQNYESLELLLIDVIRTLSDIENFNVTRMEVRNLVKFWYAINILKDRPHANDMELSTIAILSTISEFNWLPFFKSIFGHDANISPRTAIILHEKEQILRTCAIMKLTCGGARTITNFVLFSALRPMLRHANDIMYDLSIKLDQTVTSYEHKNYSRKEMCYLTAQEYLPIIFSILQFDDIYNKKNLETLRNLIENIKKSFSVAIENNSWLTFMSKERIKEKLTATKYELYFPDYVKNPALFSHMYKNLFLREETHFDNVLSAIHLERQIELDILTQKFVNYTWYMNPASISAWNVLHQNKIYIPAGLLSYLGFSEIKDTAELYATIGSVIAQEIGHGYDTDGINYDANGTFAKNYLLDDRSRAEFESRIRVLVKQYNGYCPYSDICINGTQTLNNNIADNVGVRISYLAYRRAENDSPKSQTVGTKRFFNTYARLHCITRDEDYLRWLIKGYSLSPNEYRVNGPLSNMDEFGTFYDCIFSANMHRKFKDTLW